MITIDQPYPAGFGSSKNGNYIQHYPLPSTHSCLLPTCITRWILIYIVEQAWRDEVEPQVPCRGRHSLQPYWWLCVASITLLTFGCVTLLLVLLARDSEM